MSSSDSLAPEKVGSLRALEAANFFLADVQTGLGPFLAAYLAGAGWEPARVGVALSVAGIVAVLLQTPAGAVVDRVRLKRLLLIVAAAVLAVGAALLSWTAAPWSVYTSQVLIGVAGPFLAPTLAALTMGLVGRRIFDRQFGKNQAFNSAGNVFCALSIAGSDDGRVHVQEPLLLQTQGLTMSKFINEISGQQDVPPTGVYVIRLHAYAPVALHGRHRRRTIQADLSEGCMT